MVEFRGLLEADWLKLGDGQTLIKLDFCCNDCMSQLYVEDPPCRCQSLATASLMPTQMRSARKLLLAIIAVPQPHCTSNAAREMQQCRPTGCSGGHVNMEDMQMPARIYLFMG
jgi:hypothetical protein